MTPASGASLVAGDQTISLADLHAVGEPVRAALARYVGAGGAVGIRVDDPVDFSVATIAAMAAETQAFLVPTTAPPARVTELCRLEGGSHLLCSEHDADTAPTGIRRPVGAGLLLIETELEATRSEVAEPGVHFYTSGTDGRPKGVVRSASSLALEESIVGGHLGMHSGCRVLCAVPPAHGYGYTAGVFAPMAFGGTAIVAQPRLAASLAALLATHEPEIVVAVPAQYAAWAELRRRYDGPLPRVWLCGGAPLPPAARSRFQEAWGGVIAEQYGMTETGAATVDLDGTETLGRAYPGVTVTIEGAVEAGTPGEVLITTPYGPQGYVGDPAPTRFTAAGVRSGDTGWFDNLGRLHLVGRRANQLNVRGRQVDPTEVERAFWALEGVRDVAVVGVDRAGGDQWIAVFVVSVTELGQGRLTDATARLEPHKRPQRVIRLPELPKTATGKSDVQSLKRLAVDS